MSKNPQKTLKSCLFNMFANEDYTDAQKEENLWALYEGIHRLNHQQYDWQDVRANKDHECIRGHPIKVRDVYFKRLISGGWGSDWKFCAGCMAMILYFKEVDQLPPDMFTHWDWQEKEPVNITETT